ncbi:unnamed protein product [Diamesa hyperborea]
MIVLIKLIFIFSVTFANKGTYSKATKNVKRFGGNPKIDEPILATIAQVDSNLQPISQPFLGLIYNNHNSKVQPNLEYYGDEAQQYLTSNFYTRRTGNGDEKEIVFYCDYMACPSTTYSCESTVHAISEYKATIRTTTLCLSLNNEVLRSTVLSSSDHSSGMFNYQLTDNQEGSQMDEESIIFHCDQLTCPSKTNRCKSIFRAVPEEFTEIEVTTQCLSNTNDVLEEKTTKSNNPVNDRFYYELKA